MFQKLLIIFTFIWPAYYTQIAPNHNGTEKFLITGGYVPAVQTHAKHTVSLASLAYFDLDNENEFGNGHFCGGTIIGTQAILTAANCVYIYRKKPKRIVVIAGTPIRTKRVKTTQILHVKEIIIHPNYKYTGDTPHDIAILLLVEQIKEDKYKAKIVKFPIMSQAVKGTRCVAVGWGAIGKNQSIFSKPLQYADLIIFKEDECKTETYPIENTFCAGDPMRRARGACRGDGGGPLFCNGYLSGITIFNYDCNQVGPTYFTDVSKYVDWIQSQFLGDFSYRTSGQDKIASNIFVKIASLIVFLFVEHYIK